MALATDFEQEQQPVDQTDTTERTPQNPQPDDVAEQVKAIPEDVQEALKELMWIAERQAEPARRPHFKRMLEAEEMWIGNQYPIWSEKDFSFTNAFDLALSKNQLEDLPLYQYIINIYQAYGLSFIAAMAQRIPKVRFSPRSAQNEIDIATAKAASDIADLIERNNKMSRLAIREAYLLWTQGIFATYTRYIRDKKYGYENPEPIVEESEVQLSPGQLNCPACGGVMPVEGAAADFAASGEMCPDCLYEFTDADFTPPETAMVPVVSGYKQVPSGIEKISVYGGLHLSVNPYVTEFEESGYLKLEEDAPAGAIRAAYQSKAREIGVNKNESNSGAGSFGSDTSTYERNARLKVYEPAGQYGVQQRGGTYTGTVNYKRLWFRPWFFFQHNDLEMSKKLLSLFPDGVFVAFADGVFMDARNEDVDKHWDVCTAMPGQGMYREAVGGSTIPLQRQVNDAANMVAEHLDYAGAPPIFYDAQYVNGEALRNQPMRPGTWQGIYRQNGNMTRPLADLFHQPQIKIDSNIYGYGNSLIELVQVVSGVMPSLFGGQMKGNETAAAYRMARDQSMGKLLLFWAAVKDHHARVMLQAIQCFQDNRTDDVERVITGTSASYSSKYIHLADIQGSITAEPETDEDFPATMAEIRENIMSLLQQRVPMAQEILTNPANASFLKKVMATPDVNLPSESNSEKQRIEIDMLTQSMPIETMVPDMSGTMAASAAGEAEGMPPQAPAMMPKLMSTVPPDVWTDNHDVHIAEIQAWATSPQQGMECKYSNPAGYANVMAHLNEHLDAREMVMMRMAATQAMMAPPDKSANVPAEKPPEKAPGR